MEWKINLKELKVLASAKYFDFALAIENLKSHKSPSIGQIPAELFKAEGRQIRYEVHKLIISTWNKEELPE